MLLFEGPYDGHRLRTHKHMLKNIFTRNPITVCLDYVLTNQLFSPQVHISSLNGYIVYCNSFCFTIWQVFALQELPCMWFVTGMITYFIGN